MLRGISKQVVVVRDTGSDYFEEAIFIVNLRHPADDDDLAAEARRIVAACSAGRPPKKLHRGWWVTLVCTCSALLLALGYGIAQLL